MRPVRLEVEGFTAFRERATVDFDGATLFALTGPTGAGKSSLIDAMVFALYGSVPRYADRRSVEPVVSLGLEEAKVSFDFTVADAPYRAVRVVRRTKSGATTAEARLEGGAEVVSGAREVTAAVEGLLGLGFDHFTKCVVLPQGDFAEFLHDQGEERRALLRELLDLAVYSRIRSSAETRSRDAARDVQHLQQQLAELAPVDGQVPEEALAARLEQLERLSEEIAEKRPVLDELEREAVERKRRGDWLETRIRDLRAVTAPEGMDELGARVAAAMRDLARAEEQSASAAEQAERAEAEAASLPPVAVLEDRLRRHDELAATRLRADSSRAEVLGGRARIEDREAALIEAESAATRAREVLAEAERSHAAHVIAAGLEVGDICPVCERPIEELPERAVPDDLEAARAGVERCDEIVRTARAGLSDAEKQMASQTSALAELERSIRDQEGQLGQETRDEVKAMLETSAAAADAWEKRKAERVAAEEARLRAVRERTAAEHAAAGAWSDYDKLRDGLTDLGPPVPDRGDVVLAWKQLVGWAEDRVADLTADAHAERAGLATTEAEAARLRTELGGKLRSLSVAVDGHDLAVAVAVAVEATRADLRSAEERRRRRQDLEARLVGAEERRAVAGDLALYLRSNRFEQWLLEEAFAVLVDGANEMLGSLTKGAYSLDVEGTEFWIVDHRNADQRRGVRTLSGGETFLVSLALALALAEHLGSLAVDGAARLEAIFLDEGFGTLDAEALDLVASTIDELGASGRTVGVVTHVVDLAERIPVRFEVTRRGGTAVVTAVTA